MIYDDMEVETIEYRLREKWASSRLLVADDNVRERPFGPIPFGVMPKSNAPKSFSVSKYVIVVYKHLATNEAADMMCEFYNRAIRVNSIIDPMINQNEYISDGIWFLFNQRLGVRLNSLYYRMKMILVEPTIGEIIKCGLLKFILKTRIPDKLNTRQIVDESGEWYAPNYSEILK